MIKLKIEKMHCMSCFRNIDDAIKEIDGEAKLSVKIDTKEVEIQSDKLSQDQAIKAIFEAGYPAEISKN